jgi:pantoate--beta-alanine ligase
MIPADEPAEAFSRRPFMKICTTSEDMRSASRAARRDGQPLGFVPTMGALHEGHLSLVRAAKSKCHAVAVSIFVNPTQFAPSEDFTKYPRPFEHDRGLLQDEGIDFLFVPSPDEMYPSGAISWVAVEGLSDKLCGRSRPGHFRGVTTVVSKLFHIVEPDFAFFGQKDAAQVAVIRRMVRDLNFPVQIVACPIVREADGLAMSSRNVYLSPPQRQAAQVLSRALREMAKRFQSGERNTSNLINAGTEVLGEEPAARLDYLEIVDPDSLEPIVEISDTGLGAIAAFVGSTRLIDNVLLEP